MNLKAFAKANLILKVIGEENKYHLLQMLNVRINVFDEITINVNKKKTDVLKYENTNLDPNKDDLIIRALNLFRKSFDIDEYYDIVVKKEIPVGAGLGGGSCDVGTILRYVASLHNVDIYNEIKSKKANEWDKEFAEKIYDKMKRNKMFITNLGKCTQIDARPIQNSVYEKYLNLLEKEIEIVNPKVIILFGNQVSTVFLKEKTSVSLCRKKEFIKVINGKEYKCYSIFYPVGNGRFNIDKSIEDILWIEDEVLNKKVGSC